MVTIEYNNVKIEVPESWEDITLGFYETFCKEQPDSARERAALVAKICKTGEELLLGWPAEVFNRMVDYLDFLWAEGSAPPCPSITVNGTVYVVPIEEELSLGAWIDADEVQRSGENVLSGVLAIVCRPVGEAYNHKNNEARRAMFAALPVSAVLPVLSFFLACKIASDKRMALYTELIRIYDRLRRNTKNSLNRGGGTKSSRTWRGLKCYALTRLLRYPLQRLLPSFFTARTGTSPKTRKKN
jgi:hypothetical protein